MSDPGPLRAAVFASGGGSNLQALLDHQGEDTPWRIELVVTDRADIGALDRAQRAGVPSRVVVTRDRAAADVGRETLDALREHGVQVLFLAGYLKLVPAAVIAAFEKRILNVHPALLPAFGGKGMWGMHVHRAVIASGARLSGPTVHLVDEEYDRGAILAQWPVPVHPTDSPETLAARVLEAEHRLYPRTADEACRAILNGKAPAPVPWSGEGFVPVSDVGAPERPS